MRKFISFLMLTAIFAMGCSEDNSGTSANNSETFIFNEGTYLTPTIDSNGGVLTFGFKSSTSWSVVENEEWIEVEPASGDATDTEFEVVVLENKSGDMRVATIKVAYGKKSVDIILTQYAELCAENEITYRTTTGEILTLDSFEGFGSALIENTYADGYGKMRFEGEVKSIPAEAFKGCSTLSLIILPKSLESIGDSAFEECTSLGSIAIGDNVTEIGSRAFYECRSLKSVDLAEGITTIGAEAFSLCTQLESIAIPEGVKSLNEKTFYNCISLGNVSLAEGIESIGNHCFALCSALTEVELPESITAVGNYAFTDCTALAKVAFGSGIESIGNNAFASCSALSNIALPESLKSIGNYAFSNCSSIYNITIPANVESIGNYAFFNSTALYSIDCLATTAPALGTYAFHKYLYKDSNESGEAGNVEELSYAPIGAIIYVPASAVEAYKTADNWSDYATSIRAK